MISTATILAGLLDTLRGAGLCEKVLSHADSDLGAALSHLRDYPSSIAVAVPGPDEFEHDFEDGSSIPVRCEVKCKIDLLISGRQLDKRETGDPKTLVLKDAVIALLLWSDLGLDSDDVVVLPEICEPLAIEFDNGKGREAWKLTLKIRQSFEG